MTLPLKKQILKKYSIDFICIKRAQNAILLLELEVDELKTKKTLFSFFKFRKIIKKNLNLNYKKKLFNFKSKLCKYYNLFFSS